MKKQFLLLLVVIGLSACNQPNTTKTKDQNNQIASSVQLDFVKTFEGQINNKYDIILKITSNGGQISGKYFYTSVGSDIQVKGKLDNQGKLTLNEYDTKGNQTGLFSGTMVNNNKIAGNWSKPNGDKEMSFLLIESNSQYESSKTQINYEKHASISGQYYGATNSAGYNFGSVKIKYLGSKKFTFEIFTARQDKCQGDLSGTATLDHNGIGKYTDNHCELLTFKFTSKKLQINETDCLMHHGAWCYFSGIYLKTEGAWKDGKKDGLWKGLYENGQLMYEGNYKDDEKNGLEKWWSEDGQLRKETNYEDGLPDGLWKAWYENGQLEFESNFKDGKRDGLAKWWYENGQLRWEYNYEDGKEDGFEKRWYENGQLEYELYYKDDEKNGLQRGWHENGQLMYEGNYKDDEKNGLWKGWDEDGQLKSQENYRDGYRID
jgi:antitoxin component YwqK of YwqJK toxin-antitoxin module